MRVISWITVLGLMFSLLVSAAFSAGTSKNTSGETLFKENCNSCHLNGGNIVKPKEPLKKAPQLKNFKSFLTQVRKPEAPMPAFSPAKISDVQAKELYQYILDQVKTTWK